MRIGIYGGTFSPPHIGHIAIVRQAITQLSLDKVLVVPCGMPPHKYTDTDKTQRADMARLAFLNLPVELCSYELDAEGASYTINTVRHILSHYTDANITLIVGGDSYVQLPTWHQYELLLHMVDVAVCTRQQDREQILSVSNRYPCVTHILDMPNINVSSTDIRLLVQYGLDIQQLVPTVVQQYIAQHGLYSQYRHVTAMLKDMVTAHRYSHSYHVAKMGLQLAHGQQYDKVMLACTLHDCAKGACSGDALTHAQLGAELARDKFGIADQEILDAIRYHTTARPNMTWLDKIVYLADKLEESRPYPTAHLFREDLDEMLLVTMQETVKALTARGEEISPLTKEAILYYNNIVNQ